MILALVFTYKPRTLVISQRFEIQAKHVRFILIGHGFIIGEL